MIQQITYLRNALRRLFLTVMVCYVMAVRSAVLPPGALRETAPIVFHLENPPDYARRKPAKRHHLQGRRHLQAII